MKKVFRCKDCDRFFGKMQGLRVHVSRIHKGLHVPLLSEWRKYVDKVSGEELADNTAQKYSIRKQTAERKAKRNKGDIEGPTRVKRKYVRKVQPVVPDAKDEMISGLKAANAILIGTINQLLEGYRS